MNRIQSILMVTATAFSVNVAFAQTPSNQDGSPSATPPETRIVTPTTDPLVQKRIDNAQANKQYSQEKKNAKADRKRDKQTTKADYKHRIDAAKMDQKQLKQDASKQEKAALSGETTAAPLEAVPTNQQ